MELFEYIRSKGNEAIDNLEFYYHDISVLKNADFDFENAEMDTDDDASSRWKDGFKNGFDHAI